MHEYSNRDSKEYGGLITTDGKLIILPNKENSLESVAWPAGNQWRDQQNRVLVTLFQEKGVWKVELYDWTLNNGQGGILETLEVMGMVHTHPTGTSPYNGLSYDTFNPSQDDINIMSSFPGLRQYIITGTNDFEFNMNGPIEKSSLPNCQ
ncbi:hypothetical protein BLX24_05805 [Arsenicibacter rosenii]|uniref:JAB domain-containing protein n=2 Tax=Arsenicibacter rosenii TaxID=1750698 RepID=A0A1S2VPM4_9BACT|nr:hypothetical protein BLX24_05805 [Arsenicibacter rosenii]